MNSDQSLLIFIPTYNEAENVEVLFNQIRGLNLPADILFLDDNSPDGTGQIIERIAAENPNVHTIHRTGKQGIGSAHTTGIRWAYDHGYERLVTMDCDFTHSPDRIGDFLAQAEAYDVVVGSRYMQEGSLRTWNLMRKTLTHVGHLLTATFLRMPYDATGAFRLYRLDRIPAGEFDIIYSRSYSFFFESLYILWLNGCRVKEIPLELPARTYGHSKMVLKDVLRSVWLLVYLFLKTHVDRQSLLYAEPFTTLGDLEPSKVQQEWDEYWLSKKQPSALIYDLFAAFYRRFIGKRFLNYVIGKHFQSQAQILHAGCGGGQVDADIARRVSISAMDISPRALSIYRKFQPYSVKLIHGSIFEIPASDATYDGVYNLGVMEHYTEVEIRQILNEFNRVVKPGGKIALFWPAESGLTVRFLAAVHWVLRKFLKSDIQLHPVEITHARSRGQMRGYLEESGFSMVDYYFGPRDLFSQAVVVGRRDRPAVSEEDVRFHRMGSGS